MAPVLLVCAVATPARPQSVDWALLFEGATVRDPATNDSVRQQLADEIMPKIINGDPGAAAAEVPAIVAQFNRSEGGIRLQASGILVVLAQFRPDSAVVLSQAFSALMSHAHDSVPRVKTNSVSALSFLRPEIPSEELEFLLGVMNGPDESLVRGATFGVARMASSHSQAADSLDKALSQSESMPRKFAAIWAMSAAHVTAPKLVSRLGSLLNGTNEDVVRSALAAISDLGVFAITLNLPQLTQVASASTDKGVAALAQRMIERQNAAH